jgi:hypothetical protein
VWAPRYLESWLQNKDDVESGFDLLRRNAGNLPTAADLVSICHGLSRMAILACHHNLAMPKSKIDKAREERIRNEIIVDCYNESERFGGWYCYLEEKLKFPFSALCIATTPVSPLKRGEQVEVIGMLDDERHEPSEIFVRIRWRGRKMGVPLAQLEGTRQGLEAAQAIADWHYWCSRGYCF